MVNFKFFKQINWLNILTIIFDFSMLALVFGVPLYLSLLFKVNDLFDLGKLSWFRAWLFVALGAFSLRSFLATWQKKNLAMPGFLKQPKIYLPSLFLVAFLGISLLWSQDAGRSFFGSYYRNDGLVNWFCYFIFAFLVSVYLSIGGAKNLLTRLKIIFGTATASASLVSLYAICQFFGLDFLIWQEYAAQTHRAMSTLFQPNFLASFLLLTIPLAFLLFFLTKSKLIRCLFLVSGVVQIFALYASGSRGAWISFLVSASIFSVILLLNKSKFNHKKILVFGFFALFFLLLLGVFTNKRFQSVSNLSTGSSAYRIEIYQAAIRQIKASPWLGYGAESQQDRLLREYQKDWAVFESAFLLPDRAHNLFLDLLLSFGFVGLMFWLLWYFSIFRSLYSLGSDHKYFPFVLAFSFSLFSYLFSLQFSFSVATTSIYFFLFFGAILALAASPKDCLCKRSFGFLGIFLLALFCLIFSFKALVVDQYFYYFNSELRQKKYSEALLLRQDLLNVGGWNSNYRQLMAVSLSEVPLTNVELVIRDKIIGAIAVDQKCLKRNSLLHSLDLARIKAAEGDFQSAEELLSFVRKSSPFWPRIYYVSGTIKQQQGDLAVARALFGRALSLFPDQQDRRLNEKHRLELAMAKSEIFFFLAVSYEMEKDFKTAANYYGLAFINNENNLEPLRRIIFCFENSGEKVRAEAIRAMLINRLKN